MEKREKTDFILEQMRLCLLKRDYVRANIISKKINIRYFKETEVQVRIPTTSKRSVLGNLSTEDNVTARTYQADF